jgi:hypothetical protein
MDSQEFYQGGRFKHNRDLARKLKKWEAEYIRIDRISHSRERCPLNEFANSFGHPTL